MTPASSQQIDLIAPPRRPLRPWMPPSWRRAVAGQQVEQTIPAAVRRRCHRPRFVPPSEWSVQDRRMPAADSHPGAYRLEFARFAAKVMDTWAQPWVREVWFCGVDQAGKTNAMLSCIGWSIRHAPGNIFYQMPDEASSDKIMGKKLIPMLRETPSLAAYLSPRADDTGLGGVSLTNGVAIIPAWSGSATSTATFSAVYSFTDELDKARMVGKEASPVERIRKRGRNKRFSKNFFSSTPAGAYIYSGTMACVQIWAAAGRCPCCHDLIIMDEEHVVIPDGASVDSIKADPACIEYACTCGAPWSETDRAWAYEHGDWVCIKGADIARPVDVGFIESAFPLPDVSLAHIAQTILRARGGDMSAKRDLAHGIKAIDYTEEHKDRKEDAILRLRDDRPAGTVPSAADGLALIVDTQDRGFWFEVRAWRYGIDLKSWLVRAGYVPSAHPSDFAGLNQILHGDYPDADGQMHKIGMAAIDTAGHRTAECYDWCRATGALATKGASNRKTRPVSVSRLDVYPDGRTIPGGLNLYSIDTHYHKDMLANKLATDISDAGAWVLHSGYSAEQLATGDKLSHNLEDYAKQFCVEYRDERGLWQCPDGKDNHLFDCAQMGLAMVTFLGWQYLTKEDEEEEIADESPANSFATGWR